jgi:aspartate beta-hydroxylase
MSEVQRHIQAASHAAAAGRWQEAELHWQAVLRLDPQHPQAWMSIGAHAFKRADLQSARQAFETAERLDPNNPMIALSLSVVFRETGAIEQEEHALERALRLDPYFLPALLAKAQRFERLERPRLAFECYRNALRVFPHKERWPKEFFDQLTRAEQVVAQGTEALLSHLEKSLGGTLATVSDVEKSRWAEALSLTAGKSQPYFSHAVRMHIPRLPALPFYDRALFPKLAGLEAQTDSIARELQVALQQQEREFRPYVQVAAGAPVNQWYELNHSKRWSTYFLWEHGKAQNEHLRQCPITAAALSEMDMADIDGLCPNAMFSALAPHTRIPPHHGETNARLVVHLPLIVPAKCSYRVGFEWRQWKVGECLIFDDSIEHEARNDSEELRAVLIFDVWNPLISHAERELVRELSRASDSFVFSIRP